MIIKLLLLICGLLSASSYASFVSPLQVDLAEARRGFIDVANDGTKVALYELAILEWGGDGVVKQVEDPESLMVMPSIARLEPGESQRFTIVSSAQQGDQVRGFRLVIKETKLQPSEGSVNLSISYNLPVYDWPTNSSSPDDRTAESVQCSAEDGDHILTNSSSYPIRVSSAYEGIVPLTNVILPGQMLRATDADLSSIDCKGLYEFIEPDPS